MTAIAGNLTRTLLGGYDLSGWFNMATMERHQGLADTSVFTNTAETYTPLLYGGSLDLSGLWDGAASPNNVLDVALDAAFTAATGTAVTYTPFGYGAGNICYIGLVNEAKYTLSSAVKGLVTAEAKITASGGSATASTTPGNVGYGLNRGVFLEAFQTGATQAYTGPSFDNASSKTNGAIVATHITGWNTPTNGGIQCQHSANNSTFSALTNTGSAVYTVVGGDIEAVAVGTTINRYLRSVPTGTFTSVNFIQAIAVN